LPVLKVPIISASGVRTGKPITALQRIQLFSPREWEEFIHEWLHELKKDYHDVQLFGGAGDQGRDVVAYLTHQAGGPWDNYQCKHYDEPLTPGDIWLELAKLCYYTFQQEFTVPRHYYFIAPHDVGTSLKKLIEKPSTLRTKLIEAWPEKCQNKITSTGPIVLAGDLLSYVKAFDFSIIKRASRLTIIEQHKKGPFHLARFGGGLPDREPHEPPPPDITVKEARYVQQLIEAYGERLGQSLVNIAALNGDEILLDHFKRSREHFYWAEALRNFSRDHLPPGEFERLQSEIHDGVKDVANQNHRDGFERVIQTTREARIIQISGHPLSDCLHTNDRSGICHQLANEDRLTWVKKP
jgi:hypothetical protein